MWQKHLCVFCVCVCVFCVCVCVCNFLVAMPEIRKQPLSWPCISWQSFWNKSDPTALVSGNFILENFIENLSREVKFHYNGTRIMSSLLDDRYTFFIGSRWKLLRMKKFSYKFVEKIKPHVLCLINFSRNRAVCVIMWKIMWSYTGHSGLWCWIIKVTHTHTHTHSEYVILNAFP